MKFQTNEVLWKDASTLEAFIYKTVKKRQAELKCQVLDKESFFTLLMSDPDFQAVVNWKGRSEVERLYALERDRRKAHDGQP